MPNNRPDLNPYRFGGELSITRPWPEWTKINYNNPKKVDLWAAMQETAKKIYEEPYYRPPVYFVSRRAHEIIKELPGWPNHPFLGTIVPPETIYWY